MFKWYWEMINEGIVAFISIGKQKVVWFPIFKKNLRETVASATKKKGIYGQIFSRRFLKPSRKQNL